MRERPLDLPEELLALVSRIAPPATGDASAAVPVPAALTGELAALWRWWTTVSDGSTPVVSQPIVNRPIVNRAIVNRPIVNRAIVNRAIAARSALGGADASLEALLAGVAAAEAAVDSGATLLVPRVDPRDVRAARIIIALLTRAEPAAVLAQSPGMADRDWVAECTALRDGLTDVRHLRGEPLALLEALSARGVAEVVGVLLGAAARRTGCLIDGTDESAAALLADRIAFRAKDWWRAGSTSPDPARVAAVERIDLPAGLPLTVTDEQQMGAQATLAVLRVLVDT